MKEKMRIFPKQGVIFVMFFVLITVWGCAKKSVCRVVNPPYKSIADLKASICINRYQAVTQDYGANRMAAALKKLAELRELSNPPELDQAQGKILSALYEKVKAEYASDLFAEALADLELIRKYTKTPELDQAVAEIVTTFYQQVDSDYQAGRYTEALAAIRQIKRFLPISQIEQAEGMVLFFKGDLEKAAAILLAPAMAQKPEVLALKGFLLFKKNRTAEACSAWHTALDQTPDNRLAALGVAVCEFKAGGKPDETALAALDALPDTVRKGELGALLTKMQAACDVKLAVAEYFIRPDDSLTQGEKDTLDVGETCQLEVCIQNNSRFKDLTSARLLLKYGPAKEIDLGVVATGIDLPKGTQGKRIAINKDIFAGSRFIDPVTGHIPIYLIIEYDTKTYPLAPIQVAVHTTNSESIDITDVTFNDRKERTTKKLFYSTEFTLECPRGIENICILDNGQEIVNLATQMLDTEIELTHKGKRLTSLDMEIFSQAGKYPVSLIYRFTDIDCWHQLQVEVTSPGGRIATDMLKIKREKPTVYLISYSNNKFKHFPNLKYARKDIDDLVAVLDVLATNHFAITDHNYGMVLDKVRNKLEEGDIIVTAVSTHGFLVDDIPFLAVADSNPRVETTSDAEKTAIPLQKFITAVLSIPAQKAINPVLVIVDACNSGSGVAVYGTPASTWESIVRGNIISSHAAVLLSTPSREPSLESFRFDGQKRLNGMLFFHVVEAFKKGDPNDDGLSFGELSNFLRRRRYQHPAFEPVIEDSPKIFSYRITFK